MSWELYFSLSAMMFLQFTIWGAWGPVLSAYLLGPLRMSAKQTAWVYATLPLACIVSPLIAGQFVDRWLATEWFLAAAHLIGAGVLLWAARRNSFPGMFAALGLHSLLYAPTLALVNSLAFHHLPHPDTDYFWVRVWGSVAWVLIGWALAGWRRWGRFEVRGSDALMLAAACSCVMGLFCFTLPHTPPRGAPDTVLPAIKAFGMLKNHDFAIFLAISFIVGTQLQFYFVGTSRFLEDIGVAPRNIPAAMTVAQIVQAISMGGIVPFILPQIGYGKTLALGIFAWALMYLAYARGRPRSLVVASMMLHGFAFACFFDTAFIYVNRVAPADIRGSAQSLYFVVYGLGLFSGTQFAGAIMDALRRGGTFRWGPIFSIPCALLMLCAMGCLTVFKG
jgi:nucleoside transporter